MTANGGGGGREPSALPMAAAAAAATVTDARAHAGLPNVTRSGSRVCALSTSPSVSRGGVFFLFIIFRKQLPKIAKSLRRRYHRHLNTHAARSMCDHTLLIGQSPPSPPTIQNIQTRTMDMYTVHKCPKTSFRSSPLSRSVHTTND